MSGDAVFDHEALALVHRAVERAIAAKDCDGFADLYTTDGALLPPDGSLVSGRTAIRSAFSDWLKAGFVRQSVELVDLRSDGSIAYEEGRAVGSFRADVETVHKSSRYLIVHLRQQDGSWLMHRDIWTAVPDNSADDRMY